MTVWSFAPHDLSDAKALLRKCNADVYHSQEASLSTYLAMIAAADKKLITDVNVFDLFEGPSLGEGKKSVAVEVDIQPDERTLTDADLEALADRIVENVGKKTGGVLRA